MFRKTIFVGMVLASTATCPAYATVTCVSSASQLQDALDGAADGGVHNGDINFVYVVQGTYGTGSVTGGGPFHFTDSSATGELLIYGGWDAGCNQRSRNSALTVLDGGHLTQVLQLHGHAGELDVVGLTLMNGESNQVGAGLALTCDACTAVVEGNAIKNNHSSGFDGGLFISAGGSTHYLFVEGNLIANNSADFNFGAGEARGNDGVYVAIYNNTVSGNTTSTSSASGGFYCFGTSRCIVANNIFWNNTHYGLYLASSNAELLYNDYGALGGAAPDTEVGSLSLNPHFVDPDNGNFHLGGASPLVGASPQLLVLHDAEGHLAPRGGRVDLGAYFETIFRDGFD
jgi:parallel beta-helix repeat protein